MTLKFLDLYNEVAGQAWSMFDPDAESKEDMESALKSSINKALSYIWNSYEFSFREKTKKINVSSNKQKYILPNGNIIKTIYEDDEVYCVKIDNEYLKYNDSIPVDELNKQGKPTSFYIKGDYLYLNPIPDNSYTITIDYLTLETGYSSNGDVIYELKEDEDYINIPEKYEAIFKNALITLSMVYAIADETDENYAGYLDQFNKAYNILIKYQNGADLSKRVFW